MLAGNDIGHDGDERFLRDAAVELQREGDWLARLSRAVEVRKGENIFGGVTDECERAANSGQRNRGDAEGPSEWSDTSCKESVGGKSGTGA